MACDTAVCSVGTKKLYYVLYCSKIHITRLFFFFFFFGEKMVNDERREFNLSKLFGMPVGLKFVPHFH